MWEQLIPNIGFRTRVRMWLHEQQKKENQKAIKKLWSSVSKKDSLSTIISASDVPAKRTITEFFKVQEKPVQATIAPG